jgi:predicted DNA-binding protein
MVCTQPHIIRTTQRGSAVCVWNSEIGMLAYMKRTTVKLPDELDVQLRLEAKRRGMTISELTRQAIETHLGGPPERRLLAAGAGRSGRGDVSERIEEILREEWGR